jgi:hypothetical protein
MKRSGLRETHSLPDSIQQHLNIAPKSFGICPDGQTSLRQEICNGIINRPFFRVSQSAVSLVQPLISIAFCKFTSHSTAFCRA